MKKIFLFLAACVPILAQPTCTQITDVLYQVGASAPVAMSGTIDIGLGYTVGAVTQSVKRLTITAGAVSVCLVPGSYTASYTVSRPSPLTGTTPSTRYWTVPSGGPYTVSAVEGSTATTPVTSIAPSQITRGGATNGQCLAWSTSSLAWIPATCGAGGGGTWGSITGTLSSQTDLVAALALRLAAAANLSDLASASTARTNLGLGTAATQASTAFDASGAASTAQAAAIASSAASLAAYAGSTNIVTLGTVTAGTWNGTAIGLTYLPTIPSTKTSGFATVATTGAYSDLTGKPTIPTVPSTSSLLKGDGAGNASAATSGTDYVVPGGNVATATALAANGANCSAGSYPLGVNASGASESCTALPTFPAGTVVGTTDSQTLTNKSISGGQISSAVATSTALAANGTNCSAGSYPLGVDASGNSESCTVAPIVTSPISTAGKGQYWSPWGTSAPGPVQFTSIGMTLNTMRCAEQIIPPGGATFSKVNSYITTADSGKYLGLNWYDASGNLLGPSTTTGQSLTVGSTGYSLSLGASVTVPAGVNYACLWSNSTSAVLMNSNTGTAYGLVVGTSESSTSNSRLFDAAGTTTISTATITWAASLGNRTVKGNAGGSASEFVVLDWMP